METNGSNPLVSDEEITSQDNIINEAFNKYNISWDVTVHKIHDSSLRHKYLMLSCLVKSIELGQCVPQCVGTCSTILYVYIVYILIHRSYH